MYINKFSVTKIEAAVRVIFCMVLTAGLNSRNFENLVKCLYPYSDMRHFMIVTKKTLALRHMKLTLDHLIKSRSILKQPRIWLVEVVNANKQLSV